MAAASQMLSSSLVVDSLAQVHVSRPHAVSHSAAVPIVTFKCILNVDETAVSGVNAAATSDEIVHIADMPVSDRSAASGLQRSGTLVTPSTQLRTLCITDSDDTAVSGYELQEMFYQLDAPRFKAGCPGNPDAIETPLSPTVSYCP